MTDSAFTNEPIMPVGTNASAMPKSTGSRHLKRRMKNCWQLYVMLAAPIVYAVIFLCGPALRYPDRVQGLLGGAGHLRLALGRDEVLRPVHPQLPASGRSSGTRSSSTCTSWRPCSRCPSSSRCCSTPSVRKDYSRGVQLITYAPHFISTVVVVGIMVMLLRPDRRSGEPGGDGVSGTRRSTSSVIRRYFRHAYVWSGAWQTVGLLGDHLPGRAGQHRPGAPRGGRGSTARAWLSRIWHIDLPGHPAGHGDAAGAEHGLDPDVGLREGPAPAERR